MGNRRFRLSDMMPNVWFYKLRDMSSQAKRRSSDRSCVSGRSPMTLAEHLSYGSPTRNTKALDICLPPNPPIRSPKRPLTNRKTTYKPCHSPRFPKAANQYTSDSDQDATFTCLVSPCSPHQSSEPDTRVSSDPFDEVGSWSSSCSPRISSSTADIGNKSSVFVMKKLKKFDSHMTLPPILTKAASKYEQKPAARGEAGKAWYAKCDDLHQEIRKSLHEHHRSLSAELLKQESSSRRRCQPQAKMERSLLVGKEPSRKSFYMKPGSGVKVRGRNSPRVLTARRMRRTRRSVSSTSTSRSSLSKSYAVIKCSYEPEKDFRDSMMEMIMEHRIQASEDLEDLLACYLTLNSDEYHNHIVEAFKRIWRDIYCDPVHTAAGDTETMFIG